MNSLPGEAQSLRPFDVDALDADASSICALDAQLRLVYVNRAWRAFGHDNGADWDDDRWMGTGVLTAIPAILGPFYADLFERVRRTGARVDHAYECSSPTTRRFFRMSAFPCESGAYVVVHSLSHASPLALETIPTLDALYRDADGLMIQCVHCRRVRRGPPGVTTWDFVADYVARAPAGTSHGLCPVCVPFYYPS
jgi:hypothetical protein